MALKSTIFKMDLNVADLDRHVYGDFPLTLARHPSETEERMMLRVLAFALHANEQLSFGRGISTDDEPDLWQKDLTGSIETAQYRCGGRSTAPPWNGLNTSAYGRLATAACAAWQTWPARDCSCSAPSVTAKSW